ncbi:succinylglutamate desuccinylase/aspartoacylase family protein [Paenalkalicoccus suaedae]|uniref:Succinylglutamate desuccinylase/aspartoacylase family protein n=1 Tax=Paenalkalicoccus suaedae TaxID=2592382 RepID=A0A859FHF1_9BACI|nr:M14 family metallocarboxypeptidase [Paenalkalicoccus suaedae]QKS71635.1 succinylglutamate desuccinylase/aspartoacylase family protein [Paenalkalicoccus suaedae]
MISPVNFDHQVLMSHVDDLIQAGFHRHIFGRSLLGRELVELELGDKGPLVHLNAGFHAHEAITTPVLVEAVLQLLPEMQIAPMRFSIVPMVNPDGIEIFLHGPPEQEPLHTMVAMLNYPHPTFDTWKANARGVDLNNQFPAKWHVEKKRKPPLPCPRDFPGYEPLTEPEALAMVDLAKQRLFDYVFAFHTQGREFYWGYEKEEPLESVKLALHLEALTGYKSVPYIDSFAGFKDWFIHTYKKPGFTVELGLGKNPLPVDDFEDLVNDTKAFIRGTISFISQRKEKRADNS